MMLIDDLNVKPDVTDNVSSSHCLLHDNAMCLVIPE